MTLNNVEQRNQISFHFSLAFLRVSNYLLCLKFKVLHWTLKRSFSHQLKLSNLIVFHLSSYCTRLAPFSCGWINFKIQLTFMIVQWKLCQKRFSSTFVFEEIREILLDGKFVCLGQRHDINWQPSHEAKKIFFQHVKKRKRKTCSLLLSDENSFPAFSLFRYKVDMRRQQDFVIQ